MQYLSEELKRLYFASLLDLRNGINLKQVTEKSLELYLKMTASFGQYTLKTSKLRLLHLPGQTFK